MKKVLSCYFNIDRTYLTGVRIDETGITLDYINSTRNRIDIENLKTEVSQQGISELKNILLEMTFEPDEIAVTIPAESALISKIPGNADIPEEDLKNMLDLEVRQLYTELNLQDFKRYAIPLKSSNIDLQEIMTIIIPSEDFNAIENILQILNTPIKRYDITQFNAHKSFLYNYPELIEKNVIILSIQEKFIDISVLEKGIPVYYNLLSIEDESQLSEIIENEYAKISPNYIDSIDACFYYGTSLNKENSMQLWETSNLLGIYEAKRLNAFRMIRSNLTQRENEYCQRTLHIFPPCIGACLKSTTQIIKL